MSGKADVVNKISLNGGQKVTFKLHYNNILETY